MELLRGDAAQKAAIDLLADTSSICALEVDPEARQNKRISVLALSTSQRTVLIDAGTTPKLGGLFEQPHLFAAYRAKDLHHALAQSYAVRPSRWACIYLTEQLILAGRPLPLTYPDIAQRYGAQAPDLSAGLAAFAQHTRSLAHTLEQQMARLKKDGLNVVSKLEAAAIAPIAAMEERGMPFNAKQWSELARDAETQSHKLKNDVLMLLGASGSSNLFREAAVNLDSDADLKKYLWSLGHHVADVRRKTLAALPAPLGPLLASYRELAKQKNSYGENFLNYVGEDGRLHPTFEQIGANTGRMSCHSPNLQSIPKDSAHRRCFAANEGRQLVIGDYAACELRILAEMSGDPVFAEAFTRGEDLHARVASSIFGKTVSKSENPELRERAKAINFGLCYGMGAAGLARTVGCPLPEAEQLLKKYFQSFPRIKRFLEHSAETALNRGYAQTLSGRRLYFDEIGDKNAAANAGRVAKNMPIQGTNADILKIALARLHKRLLNFGDSYLVNTVHDEIVVECPAARSAEVADVLRAEMQAAGTELLKVIPVEVSVTSSSFWGK